MTSNKQPRSQGQAKPGISYAIARLHQRVFASISELTAKHGLTALQFTTLSVLHHHGSPLSSSQLARRSFMTAQSMHEVIRRLEEQDLIAREPHPEHGRKLPAKLTTKGRHVLAACEAGVADFEARMLKGFTKASSASFLAMVMSSVQNLGAGFGEREPAPAPAPARRPPRKSRR